jgi:hypothetical protein
MRDSCIDFALLICIFYVLFNIISSSEPFSEKTDDLYLEVPVAISKNEFNVY